MKQIKDAILLCKLFWHLWRCEGARSKGLVWQQYVGRKRTSLQWGCKGCGRMWDIPLPHKAGK